MFEGISTYLSKIVASRMVIKFVAGFLLVVRRYFLFAVGIEKEIGYFTPREVKNNKTLV